MSSPIILLVGQAGSGKDTVASFLVKNHGAAAIAQADPMKRLGAILFDFNEDQLWGPSSSRNAPDERSLSSAFWKSAWDQIESGIILQWIDDLGLPEDSLGSLKSWMHMVQRETVYSNKKLTPRFMLQTLGTQWGRNQSRDLWSKCAIKIAFKLLGGGHMYDRMAGVTPATTAPDRVVITDGRFRNEIINVLRVGGKVIRIDSPSIDTSAVEKAGVAGHQSEAEQKGLPKHLFSGFFYNNKAQGLRVCEAQVKSLIHMLDNNYVAAGDYPLGLIP